MNKYLRKCEEDVCDMLTIQRFRALLSIFGELEFPIHSVFVIVAFQINCITERKELPKAFQSFYSQHDVKYIFFILRYINIKGKVLSFKVNWIPIHSFFVIVAFQVNCITETD